MSLTLISFFTVLPVGRHVINPPSAAGCAEQGKLHNVPLTNVRFLDRGKFFRPVVEWKKKLDRHTPRSELFLKFTGSALFPRWHYVGIDLGPRGPVAQQLATIGDPSRLRIFDDFFFFPKKYGKKKSSEKSGSVNGNFIVGTFDERKYNFVHEVQEWGNSRQF